MSWQSIRRASLLAIGLPDDQRVPLPNANTDVAGVQQRLTTLESRYSELTDEYDEEVSARRNFRHTLCSIIGLVPPNGTADEGGPQKLVGMRDKRGHQATMLTCCPRRQH